MQPEKIKILENKYLWIKWSDDTESKISLQKMRELCPCATCLAERDNQSKNYIPLLLSSQITVSGIEAVGSYAIQINLAGWTQYWNLRISFFEESCSRYQFKLKAHDFTKPVNNFTDRTYTSLPLFFHF